MEWKPTTEETQSQPIASLNTQVSVDTDSRTRSSQEQKSWQGGTQLQQKLRHRKNLYDLFTCLTVVTMLLALYFRGIHMDIYLLLSILLSAFLALATLGAKASWMELVMTGAESCDLSLVGTLIEVMMEASEGAATTEEAEIALTRLLPLLRTSDTNLVNAKQREWLYRQLEESKITYHADLLLAILKALEQIGDEKALHSVEALIRRAASDSPVATAAHDCLPSLKQRVQEQLNAGMLLRAASNDSPETLLHPAKNITEIPLEQLLHPSGDATQILPKQEDDQGPTSMFVP